MILLVHAKHSSLNGIAGMEEMATTLKLNPDYSDLGFIINKKTHPVKAVGRTGEVGLLQAVNQSKLS